MYNKLLYAAPFLLIIAYLAFSLTRPPSTKLNQARLILSKLRGGDFTHAGDKEAIDMMLEKVKRDFPETLKGNCLDIGCGFGGTADYLLKNGFKKIWGIDVDQAVIDYAKKKYKGIEFITADALTLSVKFDKEYFSFCYLFNVLYAIEDKVAALKQIAKVSKPGAILMIFDYSITNQQQPLLDLAGKPMRPINTKKIKEQLSQAGWMVLEVRDLSETFIRWYEDLLEKLDQERNQLKDRFPEQDIAKFSATYLHILHQLRNESLGGVMIYAKRI
ncbi:MAG: class I SAM-dependent methyltransferase [Pseudomonadota bacterium]|jgi:SAM-dependent methyltransferase|nr:methyltransferase domain-containing protein [Alphaproteobacteria bacterium]